MKNGNTFEMHLTLGQLLLSVMALFVTISFGFASFEFAQARNASTAVKTSVDSMEASVSEHHLTDAYRDASARTDIDVVKVRMDRMETMLERISFQVGATPPPKSAGTHDR